MDTDNSVENAGGKGQGKRRKEVEWRKVKV